MAGETLRVDVCVIGAGSAGLSVAAGASQMGARVALVERGRMGGDCLNVGCVPSKALIHAAAVAHSWRHAAALGIDNRDATAGAQGPAVDWGRVQDHVAATIAAIAPMDSVARYRGLGVTVLQGHGRFLDPQRLAVALHQGGDQVVRARRFVLATGSRPVMPQIPGLSGLAGVMTNETLFEQRTAPSHLLVVGGGPIGVEMAQAHLRLGVPVTLVTAGAGLLEREEPELAAHLTRLLQAEGLVLHTGVQVLSAAPHAAGGDAGDRPGLTLTLRSGDGATMQVTGSHLLVATGRRPVTDGLDLERAGVAVAEGGAVQVDRRLRTTNRRIFALGDVTGPPFFTHRAGAQAGTVIRNVLFRLPARWDETALPRVTYSDPELASVGLSAAEALARHPGARLLRWSLHENDRAIATRATEGQVLVIVDRRGRVLGASLLAAHAGELLAPWILAVGGREKIGRMAGMIAPYPTLGEAGKRAAGSHFVPFLFGPRVRRLVRLLAHLP